MSTPILSIKNLTVYSQHDEKTRVLLDNLSLNLYPEKKIGLVGESGSGKTMTSLSIMGLLPPRVKLRGGQIIYQGQDLVKLNESQMRNIRGREIAMIFQNPRSALNPLMKIGDQLVRVVQLRQGVPGQEAQEIALDLMKRVGITDGANRANSYPHQLSGGMAQRVLIAMMLACQPKLLIADEPTTGLDVTIQAQIFELIREVQIETKATILLITHDLGVVCETCDDVAVVYAGQLMEVAPVNELFNNPVHPYTRSLLSSILRIDRPTDLSDVQVLSPVSAVYDRVGCRFSKQCSDYCTECDENRAEIEQPENAHIVYCKKHSV